MLIFFSSLVNDNAEKTQPTNTEISAEEYREQLESDIKKIVKEKELLLVLGAGNINNLASQIVERYD